MTIDETKDWWISFDEMLDNKIQEGLGLSEDRGLHLCITRLAAAFNLQQELIKTLRKNVATETLIEQVAIDLIQVDGVWEMPCLKKTAVCSTEDSKTSA